MDSLTLQIYLDRRWHDACELIFPEPQRGRVAPLELSYLPAYVASFGDRLEERNLTETPDSPLPLDDRQSW
ncbi:MAG: type II toxin-antitoxin system HipA family toxin, partial [Pseudomonadota bacterium]